MFLSNLGLDPICYDPNVTGYNPLLDICQYPSDQQCESGYVWDIGIGNCVKTWSMDVTDSGGSTLPSNFMLYAGIGVAVLLLLSFAGGRSTGRKSGYKAGYAAQTRPRSRTTTRTVFA